MEISKRVKRYFEKMFFSSENRYLVKTYRKFPSKKFITNQESLLQKKRLEIQRINYLYEKTRYFDHPVLPFSYKRYPICDRKIPKNNSYWAYMDDGGLGDGSILSFDPIFFETDQTIVSDPRPRYPLGFTIHPRYFVSSVSPSRAN